MERKGGAFVVSSKGEMYCSAVLDPLDFFHYFPPPFGKWFSVAEKEKGKRFSLAFSLTFSSPLV